MKDCTNDANARKEVYVSLRPHIPIRKKNYTFEMLFQSSDGQDGTICVRGKVPEASKRCTADLTPQHSIHSPLWIRMIASCIRQTSTSGETKAVNLTFFSGNLFGPNVNFFWYDYKFPQIQVNSNFLLVQTSCYLV